MLDWATLLAFAPIQAPWLLRSLRGGSLAAKHALLDRLGLPRDALPNLGSWKADTGLLNLVADHILTAKPKIVVEFGTGASTLIVARALEMAGGGTLISFDQHDDFVDETREWLGRIRARRRSSARCLWSTRPMAGRACGTIMARCPAIDLMLIDGPPWTIHPFTRGAASSLFGRIAPGGTIMLDDAARPGERIVARRWKKAWPDFDFRLWKGGTKGTLIGTRR